MAAQMYQIFVIFADTDLKKKKKHIKFNQKPLKSV